jgi:outer membrane PBP1 activator LpoA protein
MARQTLADAEQLLREGDWVGARAQFSVISPGDLAPADVARYTLLGAELAIRSGQTEEARQLLATLDTSRLTDPLDAYLADAWLIATSGEPARAAGALMRRQVTAASQSRLNDAIWDLATMTPAFEALERARSGSDVERGWWTLRGELLRSASSADDGARIRAWQSSWPDHPAARLLPSALGRTTTDQAAPPQRVALLLPLSGPLARAGRAVRDGFMSAWLGRPPEARFALAVYDTHGPAIATVYQQALADGAEVMVGPLQRDAVTALNELGPEVPVLALNYLGGSDPAPNLSQLGLAIEDDAATLAAWLRDEGRERVLVLHNGAEWTARVQQALADQGLPPADAYLLPDLRTVTESVGAALHLEESEARHAELQALLNTPLQFRPRSRSDIDAVLALVNALEVTALVPALKFQYADDLPAFATTQTLQGAGADTLRALNRFGVVEMPWKVPGETGYQAIADAFPLAGNPFASMYGLGTDAFRLVDRLDPTNRGTFTQILGNTGVLTLEPDGRWRRELARMRVERGRLSLVSSTAPQ